MKERAKVIANDLLRFVNQSPTAFQAIENIKIRLLETGFEQLDEGKKWVIEKGGKYFVERNSTSVIAFIVGQVDFSQKGFKIIGAHTDSPALKIKFDAVKQNKNYDLITTEVYGGPIIHTWLDRELSVAGRIVIRKGKDIVSKNICIEKPIAIIPNAAIHMNRKINSGFEYNKQTHLSAIFTAKNKSEKFDFLDYIAKECKIAKKNIIDADLFFYDKTEGKIIGANDDFIVVGRLDDLAMSHAVLDSLVRQSNPETTCIGVFYDNEEIGSQTRQGANSSFLRDLLLRICHIQDFNQESFMRAIANSFMISADQAHAFHPNYPEHHDPSYSPIINEGPVIKLSANYKYATTSETSSYFIKLCNDIEVPYQKMANKSDMPSGSTIGPMSSALLGIKTVDIGNPMWAMHSIRETMGTMDQYYLIKVFDRFFDE